MSLEKQHMRFNIFLEGRESVYLRECQEEGLQSICEVKKNIIFFYNKRIDEKMVLYFEFFFSRNKECNVVFAMYISYFKR